MTLSTFIALALLPLALLWLLPVLSELVTVLVALRSRKRGTATDTGTPAAGMRLAFLVPAHDEEVLIRECVDSLRAQRSERADSSFFVIADNCSDRTAAVASRAGVKVLERSNPERPGKPAAIEWALTKIPLSAFDAVVIVDADSRVDPGFADALAERGPLKDKAVQAYNGLSNEGDSWLSRLGGLLGRIRYEGQYPLKVGAGLNCPLTGNGMCLGVGLLRRVGWAADALTENWELYARYTIAGQPIDFAPGAWVGAREAGTLAHSAPQRRRWQAGRWNVLRDHWRRILTARRIGWRQKLDLLAELSIPGPMLHATLAGGLAALLLLAPASGTSSTVVASLFLLSLVPTCAWTVSAWVRHPEPLEIAQAFARLPIYGVWRVAIGMLSIATGRRRIWIRSPRPAPAAESTGTSEKVPAA